ncbi:MAG TPA: hypothetical protein VFU36_04990, partial [Jatrophihabitans sp.]|nr:hypothetical protein [Jatrophihabitans sp.]
MVCRLRAQWLSRPWTIPDTDRLTTPDGRGRATWPRRLVAGASSFGAFEASDYLAYLLQTALSIEPNSGFGDRNDPRGSRLEAQSRQRQQVLVWFELVTVDEVQGAAEAAAAIGAPGGRVGKRQVPVRGDVDAVESLRDVPLSLFDGLVQPGVQKTGLGRRRELIADLATRGATMPEPLPARPTHQAMVPSRPP